MDYASSILKDVGLDVETGAGHTGGGDKYISAVQRYYKAYEKNKANMESFFSQGDWENYSIVVHALKSNSKMIGATQLGSSFETLEMASKTGDIENVKSNHAPTLLMYGKLVKDLEPIGQMDSIKPADEISGTEAKQLATDLLTALDDFDDELSAKLVSRLSGYPFRPTHRDRLKEATEYISDFLYDEAAEIIREIETTIEE